MPGSNFQSLLNAAGGGGGGGTTRTLINASGFTKLGNMTSNGGLAAAFDGTTAQAVSAYVNAPAAGYNGFAGIDWGSGNTKTITQFKIWNATDINGLMNTGASLVKLQGSTDNFSSSIVDLMTASNNSAGTGVSTTFNSGLTLTAYRYHRLAINCTGSNDLRLAELQLYEDI